MIPAELPKVLKARANCKTAWGCDGKEILYTPSHVSMQMTMELTYRMFSLNCSLFSSQFLQRFLFYYLPRFLQLVEDTQNVTAESLHS